MATYSGTPKTWTAGETLLASDFNAEIRDPIAALSGAWTSWTPTLSQGASTNIGKTVNRADYIQVGKLVIFSVHLTTTAAGTAGSAISLTLPVTAAYTTAHSIGSGWYSDADVAQYPAVIYATLGTACRFYRADATGNQQIGVDPNMAVAATDQMMAFGIYEAA